MIKIYILDTEALHSQDFSALVDALPFGDGEKSRLMAIKSQKHKWESLGGLVALSRLLDKTPSDIPMSFEIYRAASGKPYFSSPAAPFFGISHSCGICAAAIVDCKYGEIGFDIEAVDGKYDPLRIADRFFSEEETEQVRKSKNPAETFFSLWTAKEATAKIDGGGLSSLILGGNMRQSTHLSKLSVELSGRRVMMSVASYVADQPIQIFTDNEV